MEKTAANKFVCTGCGGQMRFDPDSQGLVCEQCGREEAIASPVIEAPEYLYIPTDDTYTAPDWEAEGSRTIRCKGCGAECVLTAASMTTDCPFCGSRYVLDEDAITVGILPESLMPFQISRDKADGIFRAWAKKRFWAPKKYKDAVRNGGALAGIYMPFWTFDADLYTEYRGQGGRDRIVVRTRRVNGKTQTYTTTVTDWYPISGSDSLRFDDQSVPATRRLDLDLVRKLGGYSTKFLNRYDPAFLTGFLAERYDVGVGEGWASAAPGMQWLMEQRIEAAGGYDHYRGMQYDHRFSQVRFKHILLPAWMYAFPFGKKTYPFMVNGETGKAAGRAPVSPLKVLAAVAGGLACLFGIYTLLYFLGG